jgi:D-arabinose 1-dehydrogenase-like Zn-dependent alcohol dehydrogenase
MESPGLRQPRGLGGFRAPGVTSLPQAAWRSTTRVSLVSPTGVTTYAPLARNVKAGDRVGIIGIGGLGHMGLQYAR